MVIYYNTLNYIEIATYKTNTIYCININISLVIVCMWPIRQCMYKIWQSVCQIGDNLHIGMVIATYANDVIIIRKMFKILECR